MDLAPTYAAAPPYEQIAAVVSVATQESVHRDVIRVSGSESGIQVYQIYTDTLPNETPLFSIMPLPATTRDDAADDINVERLDLLAEKYVNDRWSREMEARLQIDHRKVEALFPRVTPEQVECLAEVRQQFKESGDNISQMLDDLGIR
ncbi:MAG: hypothetical protein A2289_20310 [Deltaproteobacteria bacterium RIFOXYA12_FULL_58_15]|nr:MAG: hypothetical protein A2289_20310 [Deltaproteobacteria bacterium RIFOXYA12_FULL_58_15]